MVLSGCPAVVMPGMCQGQKPVTGVSRASTLNTKECQSPAGLTRACQRAAAPKDP